MAALYWGAQFCSFAAYCFSCRAFVVSDTHRGEFSGAWSHTSYLCTLLPSLLSLGLGDIDGARPTTNHNNTRKGSERGVLRAGRQSGALAFFRRLLFQKGLGEKGETDGRPAGQASK